MSKQTEAEFILGSRVFQDIQNDLEQTLFEDWKSSESVEDRELAHSKMLALRIVIGEITSQLMSNKK